jgi:hypothetical protein
LLRAFRCIRGGQRKISYNLVAYKLELLKDSSENNNEATDNTSPCLATTCPNDDDVTSPQEAGTNKLITNDKTISEEQLCANVCRKYRLSTEEQEAIYNVLSKYRLQLTKRPGKCAQFEYEFKIEGSMPHSDNSRPVAFALIN